MMGIAIETIEQQRERWIALAKALWAHPETAFHEVFARDETARVLRELGFSVEEGAFGLPTALRAVWGSGKPVLGFLGEYDALPGLSQQESVTEPAPVPGVDCGHGCGHNLLCAATVAAVAGLQAEMKARNLPGTIVFYGCPAEEVLTGKVFMARGGAFRELDAAICYHPATKDFVVRGKLGSSNALNSARFHFHGVTAHAAADPQNGRSALDAVELMNVGANYLREHVSSDVRIHYAITNGGTAPNVVPDYACVWYYVRAEKRETVTDAYERLKDIARGAALMTGTRVEEEFLGGCYPCLNNEVLGRCFMQAFKAVPASDWTPEELAFAEELNRSSPERLQRAVAGAPALYAEKPFYIAQRDCSSTDVGDVSHIVPCVMVNTAARNTASPAHSWQVTVCSNSSIGFRGMLRGAMAMAAGSVRLLEEPSILAEARREFEQDTKDAPYVCPIPENIPVPYGAVSEM